MCKQRERDDLISFIVPVYNVRDYLSDCLDSLLAQTYKNYEIVIVNDCSSDGSDELALDYAEKHSCIRVVSHEENRGLAAARNTGISAANGSYVAFVDSDDYLSSSYLEDLHANAIKWGADISVCGRYLVYETSSGIKLVEDAQHAFSYEPLNNIRGLRALNSYRAFDMSMCSKLIKKSLFAGIKFPEGELCEDYYVCHQIVYKAQCIYYDPQPLYYYRQRPGSISRGSRVNLAPVAASNAQLGFILSCCPEIKWVGETSCVFAYISIVNEYARRGRVAPQAESLKIDVRKMLPSVLANKDISTKKKIQAICFSLSTRIYSRVFVSFSSRVKLQKEATK